MKIFLAALFVILVLPSQANAQCGNNPSLRHRLDDAPAVFVGTVERASSNGRTLVEVERIWFGARLPTRVEVRRDDPESYEHGRRYLFLTQKVEGNIARQDRCDTTFAYTEDVAALEPDSSIGPYNERTPMWIGILIALLVVGAWQAARARRRVQGLEP